MGQQMLMLELFFHFFFSSPPPKRVQGEKPEWLTQKNQMLEFWCFDLVGPVKVLQLLKVPPP